MDHDEIAKGQPDGGARDGGGGGTSANLEGATKHQLSLSLGLVN